MLSIASPLHHGVSAVQPMGSFPFVLVWDRAVGGHGAGEREGPVGEHPTEFGAQTRTGDKVMTVLVPAPDPPQGVPPLLVVGGVGGHPAGAHPGWQVRDYWFLFESVVRHTPSESCCALHFGGLHSKFLEPPFGGTFPFCLLWCVWPGLFFCVVWLVGCFPQVFSLSCVPPPLTHPAPMVGVWPVWALVGPLSPIPPKTATKKMCGGPVSSPRPPPRPGGAGNKWRGCGASFPFALVWGWAVGGRGARGRGLPGWPAPHRVGGPSSPWGQSYDGFGAGPDPPQGVVPSVGGKWGGQPPGRTPPRGVGYSFKLPASCI